MINPFKDVNWHPDTAARRKFALSLVLGFPALAVVFALVHWLRVHAWNPFFLWLGLGGAAAGAIFRLWPRLAKPFYLAWYFLACCIGIVVSNLLLVVFFYLAVTPIGLLVRAFGRQSLRKGFDRRRPSYWEDAKGVEVSRYYRQF